MFHNEFKEQMVLLYSSTQCGGIIEYLQGPNSASFAAMSNRCCYMDPRHGKWLKLQPQSCRPSLTAAYEKF